MANVYVEARPKGRPEGSHIDDYVVEDHADHVLGTFKTQHEAVSVGKKAGALATRSTRPAFERQEEAGSLASRLIIAAL